MKTLILYTSRHGTTENVAEYIGKCFEADLCDLTKSPSIELADYDLVLIGGPIYMGTLQTKLKAYIEEHQELLLTKQIALFLMCLKEQDTAADQFNNAYDSKLLAKSLSDGFFGGQVDKSSLNILERIVTAIAFDKNRLNSKVDYSEVDRFIDEIKSQIS